MKAVVYRGEAEGDAECVVFGVRFHTGVPTDISALTEQQQAKLLGNPMFEEASNAKPEKPARSKLKLALEGENNEPA
jgi:hypothetical protein